MIIKQVIVNEAHEVNGVQRIEAYNVEQLTHEELMFLSELVFMGSEDMDCDDDNEEEMLNALLTTFKPWKPDRG